MDTQTLSPQAQASNSSAEPMMEMNMTPMIDVMLVLIIMFITTLPIAQNAVNLAMPGDGCKGDCPKPEVVRIDVDFDGTVMWNGQVLERTQLEAKLDGIKSLAKQPEVQLYPHRLTSYKNVAAVLAAAQSRGVTSLGIIGNEQYL
ncbi:biopolymer transporter ExbD [Undibacterium cyanobacteriorum]|uniref:Biopolymer transporter ExbD n=1 Tax=Undibacterium cyanobacteriorum TaxID=3073561 RepID=A0ABY9RHS8_9BURK|nr:biopolymer transporter ExbD [Undibacterium sp. 20NA77.5]WMW80781.1 biopolymer transporter ExbD [Undibacterium sp. 20NA77.5]